MKALYVIWPDPYYIDRCIYSGIDTLLVANQHLTPEEDLERIPHWGSHKDTIDILTRYQSRVKLILVPLYKKFWGKLSPKQMFIDAGVYRQKTPCPTNYQWLSERYKQALKLCEAYGADLVWDAEDYRAAVDNDILDIGSGKYGPKYFCECANCKAKVDGRIFKKRHEWKIHAQYSELFLRNMVNVTGQLANTAAWTFDRYPGKPYIFLEHTYPMGSTSKWNLYSKLIQSKKWEYINRYMFWQDAHYIPGVWAERFTTDELFSYLQTLKRYYNGFWLYAQSRLSKNSPYHADQTGQPQPYYHKVFGNDFFKQLKEFCAD